MNYMFCFRYVDQLSVGDELLVQKDNRLTPAKVINVSNSIMQGNCHNLDINLQKLIYGSSSLNNMLPITDSLIIYQRRTKIYQNLEEF